MDYYMINRRMRGPPVFTWVFAVALAWPIAIARILLFAGVLSLWALECATRIYLVYESCKKRFANTREKQNGAEGDIS